MKVFKTIKEKLKKLIPDKIFIKIMFRKTMGYKLDFKDLRTFNEKLQYLKLYNRDPKHTLLVDKYRVREFISDVIGKEHLIPLLGVYNNYDEINFDKLPNKFVIKANHTSGDVIIINNKNDVDKTKLKETINKWMKRDYFINSREWPYKNVKRKIIIEKFMEDKKTNELRDFKFYCFNGNVELALVATGRKNNNLAFDYFDEDFNKVELKQGGPNSTFQIEKPTTWNEMIQISKKLSKGLIHVRVDLYSVNNKVYFGELTFFDSSGMAKFEPLKWDYILGEKIDLSLID